MEPQPAPLARVQYERAGVAKGFKSFTDYLASRDFSNFLSKPAGVRPILNTSTAGIWCGSSWLRPIRLIKLSRARYGIGVPVSLVNLNAFTSTTSVTSTALAALNSLRPDPSKGEVEDS